MPESDRLRSDRVRKAMDAARRVGGGEMSVGKSIKLVRIMCDMKQDDLARKSGISASYLSLIESGRRMPSISVLRRIAGELTVSPGIFLE